MAAQGNDISKPGNNKNKREIPCKDVSSKAHLNISAELLQNVLYGKFTSTSTTKLGSPFPGK